MRKIKVLNLYAGIGGNRKLWTDCEVTAVELDPELARMYQERFPNDTVIVADAHQYLLDHYKEFDFIWSSPPCPSHSRARFWNASNYDTTTDAIYPDMKLYEEIIFLKHYFKGKYVVENVIPYYDPMLNPTKIGRHMFWSNFRITQVDCSHEFKKDDTEWLQYFHCIDISSYKGEQRKIKILRNMVHYDIGLHIFELAQGIVNQKDVSTDDLFST